ncbi:putative ABC transporter permease [Candidatus Saccharibacteria bacterium]|nr:putative ABC transporter permease [Candidatus Saccharibacteria bacterium]
MPSLHDLIVIFIVVSIAGYIWEVFFRSLYHERGHRIVNAGFLLGPYCPIYGVAVVAVVPVLSLVSGSPLFIFIIATLTATVVEYLVSVVLERLFGVRWWDYTEEPFDLHGRVALISSLFWGLCITVFYYFLLPPLLELSADIYARFGIWLAAILLIIMLVDSVTTYVRIQTFQNIVHRVKRTANIKEIDINKYKAYAMRAMRTEFIPSIKQWIGKTLPRHLPERIPRPDLKKVLNKTTEQHSVIEAIFIILAIVIGIALIHFSVGSLSGQ